MIVQHLFSIFSDLLCLNIQVGQMKSLKSMDFSRKSLKNYMDKSWQAQLKYQMYECNKINYKVLRNSTVCCFSLSQTINNFCIIMTPYLGAHFFSSSSSLHSVHRTQIILFLCYRYNG